MDAEPERQQWDDPMEFLMSCISMSVGQFSSLVLCILRLAPTIYRIRQYHDQHQCLLHCRLMRYSDCATYFYLFIFFDGKCLDF